MLAIWAQEAIFTFPVGERQAWGLAAAVVELLLREVSQHQAGLTEVIKLSSSPVHTSTAP